MSVLIEKVKPVMRKIAKAIDRCLESLRDKLHNFLGRYPVYEGLVYTPQEEQAIEKIVDIVLDFFPEGPGQCLLDEDFESRCEAIEDFGNRLIGYYELEGAEVVITDDEERFSGNQAVCIFGYTSFGENKVYINANYLRTDDEQMLEYVSSTVIHELRHLMQYQIARLEKSFGVPYERRHLWRDNLVNYIEAEYDLEGYITQPLEFDARNFTNRIWQQAYSKRLSRQ